LLPIRQNVPLPFPINRGGFHALREKKLRCKVGKKISPSPSFYLLASSLSLSTVFLSAASSALPWSCVNNLLHQLILSLATRVVALTFSLYTSSFFFQQSKPTSSFFLSTVFSVATTLALLWPSADNLLHQLIPSPTTRVASVNSSLSTTSFFFHQSKPALLVNSNSIPTVSHWCLHHPHVEPMTTATPSMSSSLLLSSSLSIFVSCCMQNSFYIHEKNHIFIKS